MSNKYGWYCPILKGECKGFACSFWVKQEVGDDHIEYCLIKDTLEVIRDCLARELWVRVMRG